MVEKQGFSVSKQIKTLIHTVLFEENNTDW